MKPSSVLNFLTRPGANSQKREPTNLLTVEADTDPALARISTINMLAVVAVLGWLSTATLAVNPTVRVVSSPYSQYRGTQLGNGVTQWLGLGFAAPPLENLRFRAPQLPKPTKGVKVADKVRNIPASVTGESRLTASSQHGLICLSTPGSPVLSSQHSEDCLYLDVYAPTAATSDRPVPVYVYIQGGGLAGNANANYNGTGLVLASGLQIAVVTFNYRCAM